MSILSQGIPGVPVKTPQTFYLPTPLINLGGPTLGDGGNGTAGAIGFPAPNVVNPTGYLLELTGPLAYLNQM